MALASATASAPKSPMNTENRTCATSLDSFSASSRAIRSSWLNGGVVGASPGNRVADTNRYW